jgi:hypothetical protein
MTTPPSLPGSRPEPRPTPIRPRYPLGLPPGSVRAILVFIVLGLVWALMLVPPEKGGGVPLYLYYLMFLALGCFFAAHGYSIPGAAGGTASPLYMPGGSLRFLIVLGFVAVLGWKYYSTGDLRSLLEIRAPQWDPTQSYMPLVLLGAFFIGVFFSRVLSRLVTGPWGTPPWFQDIQAWLAVLATLAMGAEAIINGFINPGLPEEKQIHPVELQVFLAAVTGFYFGARS